MMIVFISLYIFFFIGALLNSFLHYKLCIVIFKNKYIRLFVILDIHNKINYLFSFYFFK